MPSRLISRTIIYLLLALSFTQQCAVYVRAQDEPGTEEEVDAAADPVKLFERGQDAHERGEKGDKEQLSIALDFYEQALKLRPEFPEAEYQRGSVLVALGRQSEGEQAFRHVTEMNPGWGLPFATLGALMSKGGRDAEAESLLRRALELEPRNPFALASLADLRMRAGDPAGALKLWKRVTTNDGATASQWAARGLAERATGDRTAARISFDRALSLDPKATTAQLGRAELFIDAGDMSSAMSDLRAAETPARTDARIAVELSRLYARTGHGEDAVRVLDSLAAEAQSQPEVVAMRQKLKTLGDSPEARAALEELLKQEPRNAELLARLGAIYRTDNPQRSMDYYRRAAEIEPSNADYATGYGAALVQARNFQEAARLLQRIVAVAPQNYAAHSNLAIALDELKLYREALAEYNWLSQSRPELAVTYFFIGRMHDQLGDYPQALIFYQTFLSKADAKANRLEIDKVNLRLPSLLNQIKRGEGVKPKKRG